MAAPPEAYRKDATGSLTDPPVCATMLPHDHTGRLTMTRSQLKRRFCQFRRTYATLDFRMGQRQAPSVAQMAAHEAAVGMAGVRACFLT